MSQNQEKSDSELGRLSIGPSRRDAMKMLVLGLSASLLPVNIFQAMAGPFETADFDKLVPADKKLSAAWVKLLTDRGTPSVYRDDELKYIGMPVGGLTTGQLYLGGDGTLWHWDIFNIPIKRPKDDIHYTNPMLAKSVVRQQFLLKILGTDAPARPLSSAGFKNISFSGQYPIGTVEYRDAACPLAVTMQAFSPFVPLNADESSLPATVLHFTINNSSTSTVEAELTGVLENAVARSAGAAYVMKRANKVSTLGNSLLMECSATGTSLKPGAVEFSQLPDTGTMGLALLDHTTDDSGVESLSDSAADTPVGALTRKLSVPAGGSKVVTFVLVWNFANLTVKGVKTPNGRHYATRFNNSGAVAKYVADNFDRLHSQTKLWRDTWYDSTLPYWFLDRTFTTLSTLATSTAYRFSDGRFYAWEGVGRCEGTCTHVWQYEQAMGRIFPELDVLLRERADFNTAISFKPDGMIDFRGEFHAGSAVDGQAGTILRCLRDHQTSADDAFLKRNWPSIKKATLWLIAQDTKHNGVLEGAQPNTLDAAWFGPVSWLSGLYQASLRAAEVMAIEMQDHEFAAQCRQLYESGSKRLVETLFEGEYFVNKPDAKHPEAINSGTGCEIDQVLGQSWAFQVGLGRVLPEKETRSALASLWKYNFTMDVGPYREKNKPGRWFAMAGEAGLLMCSFPRSDWDFNKAKGTPGKGPARYFNECMTGFEHQVAGHMLWEGMVTEGLAIERAIHDRYHPSRRNPWNEIECGDHYARSMASYGAFIGACGFEYHGPKGHMAFAPRLSPENFKAPFTAAQGFGTFTQSISGQSMQASVDVKLGSLALNTLAIALPAKITTQAVTAKLGESSIAVTMTRSEDRTTIYFPAGTRVVPGAALSIVVG